MNFKSTVDTLGVINDIWKVIRDFINITFIFALLWAGVGTILGLQKVDWKKTVVNLILAAILMNFSLFVTKVIIDASNIVTLGFYEQLPGVIVGNDGGLKSATDYLSMGGKPGLSNSIMQSLQLQTIYSPQYLTAQTTATGVANFVANNFLGLDRIKFIFITIFGSIFICVTAVVFIAAIYLFTKRFIILIFLMIKSPIAFAGYILPQLESYANSWWEDLKVQALWPPIFMAMLWITFRILQSPGFQVISSPKNGFSSLLSGGVVAENVNIIFRFVIVIGMLIYSLSAASKMGEEGADIFSGWIDKGKKAIKSGVGKHTVGRAAYLAKNSNVMKKIESKAPIVGGIVYKGLDNVAGHSFDGAKGGYNQTVKDREKAVDEQATRLGMFEPLVAPTAPTRKAGEDDASFNARTAEYEKKKAEHDEKKARGENYKANIGNTLTEDKKAKEALDKKLKGVKEQEAEFGKMRTDLQDAHIAFVDELIKREVDADKKLALVAKKAQLESALNGKNKIQVAEIQKDLIAHEKIMEEAEELELARIEALQMSLSGNKDDVSKAELADAVKKRRQIEKGQKARQEFKRTIENKTSQIEQKEQNLEMNKKLGALKGGGEAKGGGGGGGKPKDDGKKK